MGMRPRMEYQVDRRAPNMERVRLTRAGACAATRALEEAIELAGGGREKPRRAVMGEWLDWRLSIYSAVLHFSWRVALMTCSGGPMHVRADWTRSDMVMEVAGSSLTKSEGREDGMYLMGI